MKEFVLMFHGIQTSNLGGYIKSRADAVKVREIQAEELHSQGFNDVQISERMDVGPGAVHKYIKRLGLTSNRNYSRRVILVGENSAQCKICGEVLELTEENFRARKSHNEKKYFQGWCLPCER